VLDSPPVQAGALACTLAAVADGALLVVRAGRTLEREAKQACDRLASVQGATILGLVLNDVRE
jgi:Mrp family chromosome partitioning ATPase